MNATENPPAAMVVRVAGGMKNVAGGSSGRESLDNTWRWLHLMQVFCMLSSRLIRICRAVIIGLVLENFALAVAMEVSPDLHRKIHQDADCDDHDCIVTTLLA